MRPAKNLTGQRFGKLVAVNPTSERCSGSVIWLCNCDCGKTTSVISKHLVSGHTSSCGCGRGRAGERNSNWHGGVRFTQDGYVQRKCPEHLCATAEGYVLEHRLVMEKILGRLLNPEEVVHHEDGNPRNNDPDNLRVFPNQEKHVAHHAALKRRNAEGRFIIQNSDTASEF